MLRTMWDHCRVINRESDATAVISFPKDGAPEIDVLGGNNPIPPMDREKMDRLGWTIDRSAINLAAGETIFLFKAGSPGILCRTTDDHPDWDFIPVLTGKELAALTAEYMVGTIPYRFGEDDTSMRYFVINLQQEMNHG